jgi:precorrin-6B methylase 2
VATKKRKRPTTAAAEAISAAAAQAGAESAMPTGDARLAALESLFAAAGDGYALSREAKRKQRENSVFLDGIQYGEVSISSFAAALTWVRPQPGETFVDVGSGVGKAVLAAAMLHPLEAAIGIEILDDLHDAAERALAGARRPRAPCGPLAARRVELRRADALAPPVAWADDADVVFCTTTCFTPEMRAAFVRGAERLRVGARVIVTTAPLESARFRLLRSERLPYGKGSLLFFAYERVRVGGGGDG